MPAQLDDNAAFIQANEKDPLTLSLCMLKECPALVRCNNNIYQFNGKCYDLITDKDLQRTFHNFIRKYGIVKAWARRRDVIESLNSMAEIPIINGFNEYPDLMCLNNCILNVHTKKQIPHSKDYYFDSFVNVDYEPTSADCPVFKEYLENTFNGDKIIIENIIRLGGYLLDSTTKAGKMFLFNGNGGCLDKDTFISYAINDQYGNRINHKGGTIKMLYERFHNIEVKKKMSYHYLRSTKQNLQFSVASINENNSVFKNEIIDVVKTGTKKCYKLTTKLGKEIIATKDHKFFTGSNYVALSKLTIGDTVYIHNNTHYKNGNKLTRVNYNEVMVKYHPSNHKKIVNGYTYYRVKKCRLMIEADMNKLSYNEYIKLLNTLDKNVINKKFWTLSNKFDVHHKNKDRQDDRLENLQILLGVDHDKLHTKENYDKMRFIVVPDTIKSIELVGERETYDIKCLYPYNNYIANGIVVHNSGKSTLLDTYQLFFSPDQVSPLSLEELASGSFDKELLIKSRLNVTAEAKKSYIDAEEIKKIVTGDLIKVSRKFELAVTFRPKTKIIVACNGLPRFNDTSDGIYRRLVLIEFPNQYRPQEEIDRTKNAKYLRFKPIDFSLFEKIQAEKNAIFNLFLEGLQRLKANNYQFVYSVVLDNLLTGFKRDSDSVREFLEENYEVDDKGNALLLDIYNHYRMWYRHNVQDSSAMKFRVNEMGRRIKEVFGVDSRGQQRCLNKELNTYQKLSVYPLRLIDNEEIDVDEIDFDTTQAVTPEQAGLKL